MNMSKSGPTMKERAEAVLRKYDLDAGRIAPHEGSSTLISRIDQKTGRSSHQGHLGRRFHIPGKRVISQAENIALQAALSKMPINVHHIEGQKGLVVSGALARQMHNARGRRELAAGIKGSGRKLIGSVVKWARGLRKRG